MVRASRRVPVLVLWALLCFMFGGLGRRAQAEDTANKVQLDTAIEVSAAGDGKARVEVVFHKDMYAAVKEKFPDARKFLQDMSPDRADFEMTDSTARYDDAKSSVVLEMTQRAAAKNLGGGRWEFNPDAAGASLLSTTGAGGAHPEVRLHVAGDWGNGVTYEGEFICTLPAGASDPKWDDGRKVLSWHLDPPADQGEPRVTAELRARDRVMSTIYKVYGLGTDLPGFWLAKTVFKNEGKSTVKNLKARYRLQGYGEWSPWEKYREVVPGQTVVSVHYPVLDASIAKLKTNTPANLLLEYTYEDSQGKKHEDEESKKIVLLGVNEFVFGNLSGTQSFGTWQEDFNNAPLLAAWVSRNDGAVKQFAAMANRMAGGVGANTSDDDAIKVLKACYELLQANDFTYQHPPTLKDRTVSFDAKDVQNVKFPRETMRDRSGTCIDLAILFAAMVNAVGLEPVLALIPGHCFPLVKLPSGKFVAVETTGVGGGLRTGAAPFEKVLPYGIKEMDDAEKDGRIYKIEVRSLWTRGIANPETEDLPPDILERWGITEEGKRGHVPVAPPPGTPDAPPAVGLDAAVGLWGGALDHKIDGGTLDAFVVGIDKAADGYAGVSRADVTLKEGGKKVVIITTYKGHAKDDAIVFESTERKRTIDGGEPVLLVQAFMLVHPKGGYIEARVGNDDEKYTDFTLAPKPNESAPPAGAADGVRGSWGGDMAKVNLSPNLYLDEMVLDVTADGGWKANVVMNWTVKKGGQDIAVVVHAVYEGGQVSGDAVHWEKVPWHRRVPASGQKDDLDGNPLLVRIADGKLSGKFEGDDGWTFTLARRSAAPVPTPAAGSPFDAAAGTWGGDMHLKIDDGTVESLVIGIDKKADGTFDAGTRGVYTVVNAAGQSVRVVIVGRYDGQIVGDKIIFRSNTRKVAPDGTENWKDIAQGGLEVAPSGGAITGRIGSDADGWMTFTLVPKKP